MWTVRRSRVFQGKGRESEGLFLGRTTRGLLQECEDLVMKAHQTNEGNRRQWGDVARGIIQHTETEKHSGVVVSSGKRLFPLKVDGIMEVMCGESLRPQLTFLVLNS